MELRPCGPGFGSVGAAFETADVHRYHNSRHGTLQTLTVLVQPVSWRVVLKSTLNRSSFSLK